VHPYAKRRFNFPTRRVSAYILPPPPLPLRAGAHCKSPKLIKLIFRNQQRRILSILIHLFLPFTIPILTRYLQRRIDQLSMEGNDQSIRINRLERILEIVRHPGFQMLHDIWFSVWLVGGTRMLDVGKWITGMDYVSIRLKRKEEKKTRTLHTRYGARVIDNTCVDMGLDIYTSSSTSWTNTSTDI
jgi:hypothetical protein